MGTGPENAGRSGQPRPRMRAGSDHSIRIVWPIAKVGLDWLGRSVADAARCKYGFGRQPPKWSGRLDIGGSLSSHADAARRRSAPYGWAT